MRSNATVLQRSPSLYPAVRKVCTTATPCSAPRTRRGTLLGQAEVVARLGTNLTRGLKLCASSSFDPRFRPCAADRRFPLSSSTLYLAVTAGNKAWVDGCNLAERRHVLCQCLNKPHCCGGVHAKHLSTFDLLSASSLPQKAFGVSVPREALTCGPGSSSCGHGLHAFLQEPSLSCWFSMGRDTP